MKALSKLPALFPTCDTGSCREDFQSSAADYFHFGLVCIRHKLRGRFRHFHGNRSALGGSCELELKFPPHLNEKKGPFTRLFIHYRGTSGIVSVHSKSPQGIAAGGTEEGTFATSVCSSLQSKKKLKKTTVQFIQCG